MILAAVLVNALIVNQALVQTPSLVYILIIFLYLLWSLVFIVLVLILVLVHATLSLATILVLSLFLILIRIWVSVNWVLALICACKWIQTLIWSKFLTLIHSLILVLVFQRIRLVLLGLKQSCILVFLYLEKVLLRSRFKLSVLLWRSRLLFFGCYWCWIHSCNIKQFILSLMILSILQVIVFIEFIHIYLDVFYFFLLHLSILHRLLWVCFNLSFQKPLLLFQLLLFLILSGELLWMLTVLKKPIYVFAR